MTGTASGTEPAAAPSAAAGARAVIRTVLGDIAPEALGPTDYHEHLFQTTPLLPGDDLDDAAASTAEAHLLQRAGAAAMVDATPIGLGRRPQQVATIAATTGLQIVHVTGVHRSAHYRSGDLTLSTAEQLLATFSADLLAGMDGTSVRAGAVKAGVGLWQITAFERAALQAAGELARRWSVPVMVHLESCSAAHEVLDELQAAGCAADRVALAHADRNPDPGLHAELAARGAYLGYDGAARHQRWPDSMLIDCLRAVVAAGHGDRLLLGGDVARRSRFISYGGMPGMAYLFQRFVPRVRQAVGEAATDRILIANPARWLTWRPPAAGRGTQAAGAELGSNDTEPADSEPGDREPADREPTDRAPTDRAPTDREPTDRDTTERAPTDQRPNGHR